MVLSHCEVQPHSILSGLTRISLKATRPSVCSFTGITFQNYGKSRETLLRVRMLPHFSHLTYTFQALHSPRKMAQKSDSREHLEERDEEKKTGIQPVPQVNGTVGLRTVDEGYSADQVVAEIDKAEGRRILRKVDFRLIPLLSFLYL